MQACQGRFELSHTMAILSDMGFSPEAITATLAGFEARGGHCDCEVLMNCAPLDVIALEGSGAGVVRGRHRHAAQLMSRHRVPMGTRR